MARQARIVVPGAVHHIMAKGIDGRDLYLDDEDRTRFLDMLADALARGGFRCYAWALMSTHYHLVVRASQKSMAAMMKRVNSTYARHYNKKYGRRGYLFQDRYKSIATQDQNYMEELIRYVHLNPLRSGVCRTMEALARYPWCGHAAVMGVAPVRFQDVKTVLRRFGKDDPSARKRYREFLAAGMTQEGEAFIEKIRASNRERDGAAEHSYWVLGDREFVKQALAADKERKVRLVRCVREGWDLNRLAGFIAGKTGVSPSDLTKRGHGNLRSHARKLFMHLAYAELGCKGSEIGRYLGISLASVTRARAEGERIAADSGVTVMGSED